MSVRLDGRVAVVTGGGGGIGQITAQTLAQAGADVAVADVASTDATRELIEATGQRFFGMQCDVSKEAEINKFAAMVEQELGPVDILVNNAAIAHLVDIENTTLELWNRTLEVNITSCFLSVKAFLEQLKRSQAGRVINMSTSSYLTGSGSFLAYVTSKGAVNGFTHTVATDLGKYNITVNSVAPSLIRTPMTLRELPVDFFGTHKEKRNLKREQTPQDAANVIAFLASDAAAFITGQVIAVDGGLTRH